MGPSLRPRRESVDYTGSLATSNTPKWLKTSRKDAVAVRESEAATEHPEAALSEEGAAQTEHETPYNTRKGARKGRLKTIAGSDTDDAARKKDEAEQIVAKPKTKARAAVKTQAVKTQEPDKGKKLAAEPKEGRHGKKGAKSGSQGLVADGDSTQSEQEKPAARTQRQRQSQAARKREPVQSGEDERCKRFKEQSVTPATSPVAEEVPDKGNAPGEAVAKQPYNTAEQPDGVTEQPDVPQAQQADTSEDFQEAFDDLVTKYSDLKQARIADMEGAIKEIKAREANRTAKAMHLANHWEAEAQRQAAIAQHGDIAVLERENEALQEELHAKQKRLIDADSQLLQKEEENAELKHRMWELVCLVEKLKETQPESPSPLQPGGSPEGDLQQIPHAAILASGSGSLPKAIAEVQSVMKSAEAALQQRQAAAGLLSKSLIASSGKAKSIAGQPSSDKSAAGLGEAVEVDTSPQKHIKEAAAACPEGASLSEPYKPPQGMGDAAISASPSIGQPNKRTPLVPYAVGLSAHQQLGQSRFGAEAAAQRQEEEAHNAHGNPSRESERRSEGAAGPSPVLERQLSFTPMTTAASQPAHPSQKADPGAPAPHVNKDLDSTLLTNDQMPLLPPRIAKDMAVEAVNMMSDMTFTTSDHPGRLRFQHPLTGFEFDVGEESDADKNDDFEGGVCYRVIHLGNAAKQLPPFLKDDLRFKPEMRPKLFSHLLKWLSASA